MKIYKMLITLGTTVLIAMCAMGCSTSGTGKDIEAHGPTVLNARVSPGTIDLNPDLRPKVPGEILADVKDFDANVTDVRVRFKDVPLEVPMQRLAGSTWRAVLTQRQIKQLAVSGSTMKYSVDIIAKDDAGRTAVSPKPIEVAVKTPELATSAG